MIPLRRQFRAGRRHALCSKGRVRKRAHREEPRYCVTHAHRVQFFLFFFKNNLPRFHRHASLWTYLVLPNSVFAYMPNSSQNFKKKIIIHLGFYSELNNLIQSNAPVSDTSVNLNVPKASRSSPICSPHERFIHQDHLYLSLSLFFNAHIHSINLASNSFIYLFRRPRYHSLLFSSLSNDYPGV